MTITLACFDMAGTTIVDGGTVEAAFGAAMTAVGADAVAALPYVRRTMGQSKIEVFRALLDDERRAAQANVAFEDAYAAEVAAGNVAALPGAAEALARLREHGVAVCLTTGFAPPTRDAILDAVGWRDLVDLALSPADASGHGRPSPAMVLTAVVRLGVEDVRHVAVAGDTTSDLLAGWRSGASVVAGVLTGAHDRATLTTAPHTTIEPSVVEVVAAVLTT